MLTKLTLDYAILDYASGTAMPNVLEVTGEITPQAALEWRRLVPPQTGGFGIFRDKPDVYLAVQPFIKEQQPLIHITRLPRETYRYFSGNISVLNSRLSHLPSEAEAEPTADLPADNITSDVTAFSRILESCGELSPVIALIDVLLQEKSTAINNVQDDIQYRMALIQSILLLLPAPYRPEITFATWNTGPIPREPRVYFDGEPRERRLINFPDDLVNLELQTSYAQYLQSLWDGNVQKFTAALRGLDQTAEHLEVILPMRNGLAQLTERHILNQQVMGDHDEIDGEALKEVLNGDTPPPAGELRSRYIDKLLEYCLHHRDVESVNILSTMMAANPNLDQEIHKRLQTLIDTEPDAVYFFVRTRLAQDMNETWLPLLQSSAQKALQVAIQDGDGETLINWLRLIAREPANYELGSIVQDGIVAAQKRTHSDGEFGNLLFRFVCKRRPTLVDTLLNDEEFLAILSAPLGPAFRDYNGEDVRDVLEQGRELSLVLMGRAAQELETSEPAAAVFTSPHIDYLWMLHKENTTNDLPEKYHSEVILRRLVNSGILSQSAETTEAFIGQAVSSADIAFALEMISLLAEKQSIVEPITAVFQKNATQPDQILSLITSLIDADSLTQQQALDILVTLADDRNWPTETVPFAERIARLLQQDTNLTVSTGILWRLLSVATTTKNEVIVKVISRRLVSTLEELDDVTEIAKLLQRLREQIQWSQGAITLVLNWWRSYASAQPLARLNQLDKALENYKALTREQAILQTMIALRKMMGNRSLDEFAQSIATAYTVLEAFSDSFDPDNKPGNFHFDQETVRTEFSRQDETLAPNESSVLAKNLRELAQLIITMAESRSKATLIRREEDIERQIMSGEQQPQSAIDTMKWLSGYFNERVNHEE